MYSVVPRADQNLAILEPPFVSDTLIALGSSIIRQFLYRVITTNSEN